ncbi:MAG: DNA-methyltransferase [Planctomycetota bacterium]|jgi:site-specific DNA-methyltransferase (adenine-specific)
MSDPQNDSDTPDLTRNQVLLGDNLEWAARLPDACAQLIYLDPPFNTGKRQRRLQQRAARDDSGAGRPAFGGKAYFVEIFGEQAYEDRFDDYLAFLAPRFEAARRLLKPEGSFFVHLDYREVHYAKVLLDGLFGRNCFQNELIWAYDYGARSKLRWSTKHETILWYTGKAKGYVFHFDAMDRIPYMAPGLVGKEKAARGKTPTDVWWHTIVSPTGAEKTGYPSQKPLGVLERLVKVHSSPGDLCLDLFAGSGTLGEAAARHDRRFCLVDENPEAVQVMRDRLAPWLGEAPGGQEGAPEASQGPSAAPRT